MCWKFFELPKGVRAHFAEGSYEVEGCVSSLLGASLVSPEKLFFGAEDSRSFFCDMNAVGSRHKGRNLRIILINSTEHHGDLLKDYAEGLGFEYLCASNKKEYLANLDRFTTPEILGKPVIFEAFTDHAKDSEALSALTALAGGSR